MSTLKTNTLSNVAGTQSTAIENAINGSAKAWVNFNGTGTVAIRASYNVSSITDNGTGDYTVNFTTAMSDANYATNINMSIQWGGGWAGGIGYTQASAISGNETPTTSKFRFTTPYYSGATESTFDPIYVMASVFR